MAKGEMIILGQNYPVKAIASMIGYDYRGDSTSTMADLLDHPYVSVQHSQ
jgi:hypothetical protein